LNRTLQKVLVTGASGFVGTALCRALVNTGLAVRRALRTTDEAAGPDDVAVGDLGPATAWGAALQGTDAVVHLAARTHALHEAGALAAYRSVNVMGSEQLARAAAQAGVGRLVFVSSVKVNGERTTNSAFDEASVPQPEDSYGISKREAEDALWKIAAQTGLEIAVLRPPLLYGPGVKGNLRALFDAVARGFPLPFGSIQNRRSLLYVDDLVAAIIACLEHPAARGRSYLVASRECVSTPELVRNIAAALGRPARLLPCPPSLLRAGAALCGRSAAAARLIDSLVVDPSRIELELGWRAVWDLKSGLATTAQWYYQRP
jgi:nucleoside-diphosphate-sugar epimerase